MKCKCGGELVRINAGWYQCNRCNTKQSIGYLTIKQSYEGGAKSIDTISININMTVNSNDIDTLSNELVKRLKKVLSI